MKIAAGFFIFFTGLLISVILVTVTGSSSETSRQKELIKENERLRQKLKKIKDELDAVEYKNKNPHYPWPGPRYNGNQEKKGSE